MQALRNLKSQSIYFGSPRNFNDPYDSAAREVIYIPNVAHHLLAADQLHLTPPSHPPIAKLDGVRRAKEHQDARNTFLDKNGVACFTACNDNLLMWSHYGGQHCGFCLEFRTECEPFNDLRKVVYSKKMPEIDLAQPVMTDAHESIMNMLCTKSKCWEYEQEWRATHADAGTVVRYERNALKAIYFGSNINAQDRDLLCMILSAQNPDVAFYRGACSTTEFRVDFRKYDYPGE